jgi:formiminotetrahydrofolate cyclodeaminase
MSDAAVDGAHLSELPVRAFLDALAAGTPTPGGGSAAALAGASAAALVCMVARVTLKRGENPMLAEALRRAEALQATLTAQVDEDARAYERVLAAYRLPKDTPEQKATRTEAIQAGLIRAAETPLQVATACVELLELAGDVARRSIPSAVSDAAVAALLAHAGLRSAALNVTINLEQIKDDAFCRQADRRLDALLATGQPALARALAALEPGA